MAVLFTPVTTHCHTHVANKVNKYWTPLTTNVNMNSGILEVSPALCLALASKKKLCIALSIASTK